MSSEKILQKISEKDLKENLTEEQYEEFLENEKVEKLEEAKPFIKQDFLSFVSMFGQILFKVLIIKLLIKNLMTSHRGKLNV